MAQRTHALLADEHLPLDLQEIWCDTLVVLGVRDAQLILAREVLEVVHLGARGVGSVTQCGVSVEALGHV